MPFIWATELFDESNYDHFGDTSVYISQIYA